LPLFWRVMTGAAVLNGVSQTGSVIIAGPAGRAAAHTLAVQVRRPLGMVSRRPWCYVEEVLHRGELFSILN
jgi:hypothetical protein